MTNYDGSDYPNLPNLVTCVTLENLNVFNIIIFLYINSSYMTM